MTGTHQGLVGAVAASDADSDPITYRMVEITGAHADRPWHLPADGLLFADFLRDDAPGSEFTQVRVIASDGVDASETVITVRWGSAGSPNPEFSQPAGYVEPAFGGAGDLGSAIDWIVA